MVEIITGSVEKALQALSMYEYMTVAHMVAAGVSPDPKHIRTEVRDRLDRPRRSYIERMVFNRIGDKRVSDVMCLTVHGADLAAEVLGLERSEILYPKGGIQFTHRDYFHRMRYIDCHIALRNWATKTGNTVEFVKSYFTKDGSQRGDGALRSQSVTRVEFDSRVEGKTFMEPDGIACFKSQGKSRLCAIELHRKTETGRIIEQLKRHLYAMDEELLSL